MFPPARILDLEAKILDLSKPDVTLTFTAPGDNLMTGAGKRPQPLCGCFVVLLALFYKKQFKLRTRRKL